jgi:hypothetical protein
MVYVQTIFFPSNHLLSYLFTYIYNLFLIKWVTKVKPKINSGELHSQLSRMERASGLGAGSC